MNKINVTDSKTVGEFIAGKILEKLKENKKVLWLISGGSSQPSAVEAAKIISMLPHDGLTVSLTDERYGPVGHADSNWKQMMDKGFDLPGARLVPILDGNDREVTTKNWAGELEKMIGESDYQIALFGIGADGHIAGMLPHTSPLESAQYATSYVAGPYERITITPVVMKMLDEVVGYTVGENKWSALQQMSEEGPIVDIPARQLKEVPGFTLYTDWC